MTREKQSSSWIIITVVLTAAVLLLSGCGDSGAGSTSSASAPPTPTGTPAAGPYNGADIEFAAGMIPHHAQAVEMGKLLLAKKDIDTAVADLAQKIKDAQAPEIEQMRGWLAGWDAPVPATDAPLDLSEHGGMPGMMSNSDMTALAEASGNEAGDLFLEQMITHHLGAVEMAQSELDAGENSDAKTLAQEIVTTQQSEITTMTELLGS